MKTYKIVFNSCVVTNKCIKADGYENYYQTYRFFTYGEEENSRQTVFSAPLCNVLYVEELSFNIVGKEDK